MTHPKASRTRPTNKPAPGAGRVCVGVIAGANGLDGALRVKAFTEDPNHIGRVGPLGDDDGHPLALSVRAVRKGMVIAKIDGVTDHAQAERLKGRRLYVARAALPEPPADEFYHADLIGLSVERTNGASLGTVAAVNNY